MSLPLDLWGLEFNVKCYKKIFIAQIRSIDHIIKDDGILYLLHNNKPISKVEVVGIITSIKYRFKKTIVSLDDGTGIITCVLFRFDDSSNDSRLQVGQFLSVHGMLIAYNDGELITILIHTESMVSIEDPNMEILHWTSTIMLHKHIYSDVQSNCRPISYIASPSWIPNYEYTVLIQ